MKHTPVARMPLLVMFSLLAGYVDVLGFLSLNGVFVSFMSGNTTRLGVGLVRNAFCIPLIIIACFIIGVICGSLLGKTFPEKRYLAVTGLTTVLINTAALINHFCYKTIIISILAFAMGAANTIFEKDGEVGFGITYMTGALVKAGVNIAGTLSGSGSWIWLRYICLWLGLLSGAVIGTCCYTYAYSISFWIAGALSFIVWVWGLLI